LERSSLAVDGSPRVGPVFDIERFRSEGDLASGLVVDRNLVGLLEVALELVDHEASLSHRRELCKRLFGDDVLLICTDNNTHILSRIENLRVDQIAALEDVKVAGHVGCIDVMYLSGAERHALTLRDFDSLGRFIDCLLDGYSDQAQPKNDTGDEEADCNGGSGGYLVGGPVAC
jgi:hypothetical protein